MDASSLDGSVVANWREYHRIACGQRPERKALESGAHPELTRAVEAVDELVAAGCREAVAWLSALNDAAPAGDDGQTVGCGPLEDLINEHADDVVDEVELVARQSPSFARALLFVSLAANGMAESTRRRLAAWTRQQA